MPADAGPAASRRSAMLDRRATVGALLVLAGLGVALRCAHLRPQILLGDELHAVRAALSQTLGQALTTYRVGDNCIPLTALFRFLMDRGVRLDEMLLRAPVLGFGALFLLAVPPLLIRRFGAATGIVFSALAAISPLLVFYSRIVRSYMPAVALAFAAALALLRWREGGGRRWAIAYVVLGALAVWFHLLTGPIVLIPLALAAARWLSNLRAGGGGTATPSPPGRRFGRELLTVAAGMAIAWLLFLVPAAASLRVVLGQKVGSSTLPGGECWRALGFLFAGTGSAPLTVTFWMLAALGLVVLLRRDRGVAFDAAALVAGHTAALLIVKPFALTSTIVFARYMLPVLPWILLLVAAGIVALAQAAKEAGAFRGLGAAVAASAVLALALGGPLFDPALRRSSFLHAAPYVVFPCPRLEMAADRVPQIYRTITRGDRRRAVVEAPGVPLTIPSVLRVYQELHGRRVQVTAERLQRDRRLALSNNVSARAPSLLAGDADWLLVHRDLESESHRLPTQSCFGVRQPRPVTEPTGHLAAAEPRRLALEARQMERQLTAAWGPPDSDADGIAAWNLDRLRQERAGARAIAAGPQGEDAQVDRGPRARPKRRHRSP